LPASVHEVRGFITDKDLAGAETCFPGIRRFYETATPKPRTFLELVWAFQLAKRTSRPDAHRAA
jgi:hypothetical protein